MKEPLENSLFLRACRGEKTERPPIWLMRQAGRFLPEYRELRKGRTMLETLADSDACTEITLQPIRRFGFDAAILFSDLTVFFGPMGAPFEIRERVGPVLEKAIRSESDIQSLREPDPEADLPSVFETIQKVVPKLEVPLIGFTGAPFTLASYLVEGGPSKDYRNVRALAKGNPHAWSVLMEKLARSVCSYATAQVRAGASAIQLFDSWLGAIGEADFRTFVLPTMKDIFAELNRLGVPTIYFGTGTPHLLSAMSEAGSSILGIDWRITLAEAKALIPRSMPLQGNLDPAVLLTSPEVVQREARIVMEQGRSLDGHIFNLGHGVFPETPIENVQALMEAVRGTSAAAVS